MAGGQEFIQNPQHVLWPQTHGYFHPRGPHDLIPCHLSVDFVSNPVKDDGELFLTDDVYIL